MTRTVTGTLAVVMAFPALAAAGHRQISGVYPHLTMYNEEGECGTGAVVPWAGRLWVTTYGPHLPKGSSDKLYEITPDLEQTVRPESVGGTCANRMIHRESKQLNIGRYLVDADGGVRVLSPETMPGRLTGSARHLTDPANRIHVATMEEGLYSVDVHTLAVTEHIADGNGAPVAGGPRSALPGYHGKGLYTGQGILVYANNGEHGEEALTFPDTPSGALASWQGDGDWTLIRRNQFTEVTGPGGLPGNRGDSDPLWSLGWDSRSVILMLLDAGAWHAYRLPKGSHAYDGAHGWNTEWPRIRDIGEDALLATMHGTFWSFPRTFSFRNSSGIAPRSNYLKVVGDFARWGDSLVLGCDDSAQREFLNRRPFKTGAGTPVQSNSNLWFISPQRVDRLGPTIGRGSVWLKEDVEAGSASDPYLFSGYDHRMMVIHHDTGRPITFTLQIDREGHGTWSDLTAFEVRSSLLHIFDEADAGAWIRIKTGAAAENLSVHFHCRDKDPRGCDNDPIFASLARAGSTATHRGVLRSNGRVLSLGTGNAYFELDDELVWRPKHDPEALQALAAARQPQHVLEVDAASAILKEDGRTYRIPKSPLYTGDPGRICREVATERDLFNFHGTFYELPARNAQGVSKIRPIATHNLAISDYASHFGLLFMTGLTDTRSEHALRSPDGKAAVWAGVIDDLWRLGKPRGTGGPWKDSVVRPGVPSDPYLMTGYDRKSVTITADQAGSIALEIDIDGTGLWVPYKDFAIDAGDPVHHVFPEGFSAYWVRAVSATDCVATVWFVYA